jgi:undecaprenyl-diphosphatase
VDSRLYLDVNHWAARSAWAHGVLAFFARPTALAILVVLLALAVVRTVVVSFGDVDLDRIGALALAAASTAVAYAVSIPIVHLVGRSRPFQAMPQAVVLIARPSGFSFPNEHAVIAGALVTGLWLSRTRLSAALASLTALVVAFALVYSGAAYPLDVVGGLLIGAVLTLVIYRFAIKPVRELAQTMAHSHAMAHSPARVMLGPSRHAGLEDLDPAASPQQTSAHSTIRILAPGEVGGARPPVVEKPAAVHISADNVAEELGQLAPEGVGSVRIISGGHTGAAQSGSGDRTNDRARN